MKSPLEGYGRGLSHGQLSEAVLGNAIFYPELVQGLDARLQARNQAGLHQKTTTGQTSHGPTYGLSDGFKLVDGDQRRGS